jgi:hypothetical protein
MSFGGLNLEVIAEVALMLCCTRHRVIVGVGGRHVAGLDAVDRNEVTQKNKRK